MAFKDDILTQQAKELIAAGEIQADDFRTIIVVDLKHKQFGSGYSQCLKDEN